MNLKQSLYRFTLGICIVGGVAILVYALLYFVGLRVNDTRSVAKGIYRTVDELPQRGSYVTFCPPDTPVFQMARQRGYIHHGFCPHGYTGLIKFIAGMPGDTYRFTLDGLFINGEPVGNTKPLMADGAGRELPVVIGEGKLAADEYIFIGNAVANSFDARYYGIVSGNYILDVVTPLWVEEP